MRLGPTVDGSAEGPDASLRSCVRSLQDFSSFLRTSLSEIYRPDASFFVPHLSSYLNFLRTHCTLWKFYVCQTVLSLVFLIDAAKKGEIIMCYCDRMLVTRCQKLKSKFFLLCVMCGRNTGLSLKLGQVLCLIISQS